MIPVTVTVKELDDQKVIADRVHKEVQDHLVLLSNTFTAP